MKLRILALATLLILPISSAGRELPKHVAFGELIAPVTSNGAQSGVIIGRAYYFTDLVGISVGMSRTNGTSRKEGDQGNCKDTGEVWTCPAPPADSLIGVLFPELRGHDIWVQTRPVTSWMIETTFRWTYNDRFYSILGVGLHYSIMDVETEIEDTYELPPVGGISPKFRSRNEFTKSYKDSGPLISIGVCFELFDSFDFSITIRNRFGDLKLQKETETDVRRIETELDTHIGLGIAITF